MCQSTHDLCVLVWVRHLILLGPNIAYALHRAITPFSLRVVLVHLMPVMHCCCAMQLLVAIDTLNDVCVSRVAKFVGPPSHTAACMAPKAKSRVAPHNTGLVMSNDAFARFMDSDNPKTMELRPTPCTIVTRGSSLYAMVAAPKQK